MIDQTPDGTNIGFRSHVPTDEDLITLLNIEVTSGSEWNTNTVKLGKVSMNKNYDSFELQLHVFGYHTIQRIKCSCLENITDKAVRHSINPALVELGSNLKQKISEITTPANDEIPERITFVSHARHLKASAELFSDLWCIGLKRAQATLGANTQRVIRYAILSLSKRYRADRVFSMRRLDARFANRYFIFRCRVIKQEHVHTSLFTQGWFQCYLPNRIIDRGLIGILV